MDPDGKHAMVLGVWNNVGHLEDHPATDDWVEGGLCLEEGQRQPRSGPGRTRIRRQEGGFGGGEGEG